jgi:VWFA-related protein
MTVAIAALAARAEAPTEAPTASTLREETTVRRVHWPVRFVPKLPGGCDDVRPDDIEIREDDVPTVPDDVERTRLDTIHAILIDASSSMVQRLGRAREAAAAYIDALPPEDSVLVASFSDNLVLHAPLTRDRARLREALDDVDVRLSTAFNDALYYTLRYLRSRPERKVIVALTDGCDNVSLPAHTIRMVRRLAEETDNLTVFPVGVSLAGTCAGAFGSLNGVGPDSDLKLLAHRSGGRLFKVREAAGLHHVFGEIRLRMSQEGYVSYRPLPFGDGARDRAGTRDHRRRRVRVRSLVGDRCRVVSAGAATRLEGADPGRGRDVLAPDEPLRPAPDTRLPFRAWWNESADDDSHLLLASGRILGRSPDLLRERALLYAPVPYHRNRRLVPDPDRRVRIEARDFNVRVPPFDTVRERVTSPEELLYWLLRHEAGPFRVPEGLGGRRAAKRQVMTPTWIHGQTMLELRGFVGQALFGYPGYREFADARHTEEYLDDMRRMLDEAARRWSLPPSTLRAVREAIVETPPDPPPAELQRYLAEWLGDITAHALVVGFEGWAANRVLDPAGPGPAVDDLLEAVDTRWRELPDWFPPPTRVRIVSPLVPAFDTERRTVGFYRVLLPQPDPRGPPSDPVPPFPLALTFTRTVAAELGDDVKLRGIDYAKPSKRVRRRLVRRAKRGGRLPDWLPWRGVPVVWLELGSHEPDGPAVELTVLFDPRGRPGQAGPRPVCIEVPRRGAADDPEWKAETAGRLTVRVPPCSAPPGAH